MWNPPALPQSTLFSGSTAIMTFFCFSWDPVWWKDVGFCEWNIHFLEQGNHGGLDISDSVRSLYRPPWLPCTWRILWYVQLKDQRAEVNTGGGKFPLRISSIFWVLSEWIGESMFLRNWEPQTSLRNLRILSLGLPSWIKNGRWTCWETSNQGLDTSSPSSSG